VIEAGAYGVTVHPRPDERHIRYADVYALADVLDVEFNIEGNPFTGRYMEIVREVKPDQATLVPDDPGANTSDHGWDLKTNRKKLIPIIKELKDLGIRVSIFMDADNKIPTTITVSYPNNFFSLLEPFNNQFFSFFPDASEF